MSNDLSQEIATLASEARHHRIHEHGIIKELTMIVGYAHMAEIHPDSTICALALRKHLQRFADLAGAHEHYNLCEHTQRIVDIVNADRQLSDVA